MAQSTRFCAFDLKSGIILADSTQTAVTSFLLICNLSATIYFARNICICGNNNVEKKIKILCSLTLAAFNLEILICLIGKIACLVNGLPETYLTLAAVVTLGIHSIACVILLIFFTYRLERVFVGTFAQVSNYTFYFIKTCFFVGIGLLCIGVLMYRVDNGKYSIIGTVLAIIAGTIYCAVSLLILLLFLISLHKITIVQKSIVGKHARKRSNSSQSDKVKQRELVQIAARFTLLVAFSIVSTFGSLIIWGTRQVLDASGTSHEHSAHLMYLFYHFWLNIDSVINTYCLIFQFSFSNSLFYKLCGICNQFCQSYCLTKFDKSYHHDDDNNKNAMISGQVQLQKQQLHPPLTSINTNSTTKSQPTHSQRQTATINSTTATP